MTEKLYNYVYQTKNLINNKTYIGVHCTNDLDDNYLGSGLNLKRAIKKYGINNFKKEILAFYDTKKEAFEEENFLVNDKWVEDTNNYNISVGGYGGNTYKGKTEQELNMIREKLKNNNKGKKFSDDIKNKMSLAKSGELCHRFKTKASGLPLYINLTNNKEKFLVVVKRTRIGVFSTLEEAIIMRDKFLANE